HRDVLRVRDDAADRLRIAEMAVGAQHAAHHAAVLHAARHLLLGAVVVLAEDLDLGHRLLLAIDLASGAARRKAPSSGCFAIRLRERPGLAGEAGIEPAPTRFWRPPLCR